MQMRFAACRRQSIQHHQLPGDATSMERLAPDLFATCILNVAVASGVLLRVAIKGARFQLGYGSQDKSGERRRRPRRR